MISAILVSILALALAAGTVPGNPRDHVTVRGVAPKPPDSAVFDGQLTPVGLLLFIVPQLIMGASLSSSL